MSSRWYSAVYKPRSNCAPNASTNIFLTYIIKATQIFPTPWMLLYVSGHIGSNITVPRVNLLHWCRLLLFRTVIDECRHNERSLPYDWYFLPFSIPRSPAPVNIPSHPLNDPVSKHPNESLVTLYLFAQHGETYRTFVVPVLLCSQTTFSAMSPLVLSLSDDK